MRSPKLIRCCNGTCHPTTMSPWSLTLMNQYEQGIPLFYVSESFGIVDELSIDDDNLRSEGELGMHGQVDRTERTFRCLRGFKS